MKNTATAVALALAATATVAVGPTPAPTAPFNSDVALATIRQALQPPADPTAQERQAAARRLQPAQRQYADTAANGFFDPCHDAAYPGYDLDKSVIADNFEYGAMLFLWSGCANNHQFTDSPFSLITWFIDTDSQHGNNFDPEYAVNWWGNDTYSFLRMYDTSNPDTWYELDSGPAYSSTDAGWDGRHTSMTGTLAIDWAYGTGSITEATVRIGVLADGQERQADHVPDTYDRVLHYPNFCDVTWFANVTTERGLAGHVANELSAAGHHVQQVLHNVDALQLTGIDDETLTTLNNLPGIVAAQRPEPVTLFTTNDPHPNWWAYQAINADGVRAESDGPAVRVAVLDGGVDGTELDLRNRIGWGHDSYYDGIGQYSFQAATDSALGAHGTAVSALIAATPNNEHGTAGLTPNVTIHPHRIFNESSCSNDFSIASALDNVIFHGIPLVNISAGGSGASAVGQQAVDRAAEKNIIIVAASGNDGTTEANYPAAYDNVISVGATEPTGNVTSYSNKHRSVDIVAPGGMITSSPQDALIINADNESYEPTTGTSFAAPLVTAALARWYEHNRGANVQDALKALRDTARPLNQAGAGAGMLNVGALLSDTEPAPTQPDPQPDPQPESANPDGGPPAGFPDDTTKIRRLDTDDPFTAAITVSQARYPRASTADIAIITRHDAFADALAATPLSADGPLLYAFGGQHASDRADHGLPEKIRKELLRALPAGPATVYIIGGHGAVNADVDQIIKQLNSNWTVLRLSGPDRFTTSRKIAHEVRIRQPEPPARVLLARGHGPASDPNGTAGWVDSITASGYAAAHHYPMILVPTDAIDKPTLDDLQRITGPNSRLTLLGGSGAIAPNIEKQLTDNGYANRIDRVAGPDRAATAAKIHDNLWRQDVTINRNVIIINLWDPRSWTLGLVAAGISADAHAPMIPVLDEQRTPQDSWYRLIGCRQVRTWALGNSSFLNGTTLELVEARDRSLC